jgi:hypothetical protein
MGLKRNKPILIKMCSEQLQFWNFIVQSLIAVGIITTVIIALFSEKIKSYFLSPQLSVELRTKEGNLTQRANGVRTIYYHFIVYNKKKNNIARNAKVICEKLYVINSKGEIYKQPITTPLPLQWAFSEFYGYTINIKDNDYCLCSEEYGIISLNNCLNGARRCSKKHSV